MNKLKEYFYHIPTAFVFFLVAYYFEISGLVSLILSYIFYGTILYIIHLSISKIRKKEPKKYKEYFYKFIYRFSIFIIILLGVLWYIVYHNNYLHPADMPLYTISNWEKIVKFQAMSHIGSQSFYNEVRNEIKKSKSEDFVLFYEWVKPGTEESMQEFNQAIWIQFDENTYHNFSKLYWLVAQDNEIFLNIVNNLDYNIDLDIDTIMDIYEVHPDRVSQAENSEVLNLSDDIMDKLADLWDKELKILIEINRAMLNIIIKNEEIQQAILDQAGNQTLFDVILDDRNKLLANEIINSKFKKIHITYWLMHFAWVLEILREDDPNWKIVDTTYLYPIKD